VNAKQLPPRRLIVNAIGGWHDRLGDRTARADGTVADEENVARAIAG
jgi:hypothetical protein